MKNIAYILTFILMISCDSLDLSESSSETDSQPAETNEQEVELSESEQFFALVDQLDAEKDEEKIKTILGSIKDLLTKENVEKIKDQVSHGIKTLQDAIDKIEKKRSKLKGEDDSGEDGAADDEGDAGSDDDADADAAGDLGDIIDTIGEIIEVVVNVIKNTGLIGGMGCKVDGKEWLPFDVTNPPGAGSDVCKLAKCVYNKCKAPKYEKVLCSDDAAWNGKAKPNICNVPGNAMCGIPTGVCVPKGKDPHKVLEALLEDAAKDHAKNGGGGNPPAGGGGNPPAGGGNPPAGGDGNPPAGGDGNPPADGDDNPPADGNDPGGDQGAANGGGGATL